MIVAVHPAALFQGPAVERLGLAEPPAAPTALTREQVLAEVASGALGPEEAAALLADL